MYLTFAEYNSMGGTLEETTFNNLEFRAQSKIDWYTFSRLRKEEEQCEEVKRCVYALIDLLNTQAQATNISATDGSGQIVAGIASQSNDGVSVSYNVLSARDGLDVVNAKIKETIQEYLQDVKNSLGRKVLYRGFYPGE